MPRSAALLTSLLGLLVACSKAPNQDTGASGPTSGNPTKISVPGGGEGMPADTGGMLPTTAGSGEPATKGAGERFKLKANEGKLAIEVPEAKAGAESVAKITVTPGDGFKVNAEYPTKLTLTAPDGVVLAKKEFIAGGSDKAKGDADQLDDKALIISVKLTPSAAGNYTINGEFKFAVCDADQCLAKKETIALQVAAK